MKLQKGFTFVEVLVVVVVLVALGFTGWNIWKKVNVKKQAAQGTTLDSPAQYSGWKTYTDNTYTVRYPADWTQKGSTSAAPLAKNMIRLLPPGVEDGAVVSVNHLVWVTDITPKKFATQTGVPVTEEKELTINGRQVYYQVTNENGTINRSYVYKQDADKDRDHFVSVTLSEKNTAGVDNTAYIDTFEKVAHSVTFNAAP